MQNLPKLTIIKNLKNININNYKKELKINEKDFLSLYNENKDFSNYLNYNKLRPFANQNKLKWDYIKFRNDYNLKSELIYLNNFNLILTFFQSKVIKEIFNWKEINLNKVIKAYLSIFNKNDPNYFDIKYVNNFNDYCIKLNYLKKHEILSQNLSRGNIKSLKLEYYQLTHQIIIQYFELIEKQRYIKVQKKELTHINCFFKYQRNNIIGMVTDNKGKVIQSISSGRLLYKGKKKKSILAAKDIANWLINFIIKKKLNTKFLINLRYKGWSPTKNSLTHFFSRKSLKSKLRLSKIVDSLSLPHNGCRLKKKPRK